eukprot:COSAG04_NODE_6438_length_1325_cov_14.477528_2_plen_116_part_01
MQRTLQTPSRYCLVTLSPRPLIISMHSSFVSFPSLSASYLPTPSRQFFAAKGLQGLDGASADLAKASATTSSGVPPRIRPERSAPSSAASGFESVRCRTAAAPLLARLRPAGRPLC